MVLSVPPENLYWKWYTDCEHTEAASNNDIIKLNSERAFMTLAVSFVTQTTDFSLAYIHQ